MDRTAVKTRRCPATMIHAQDAGRGSAGPGKPSLLPLDGWQDGSGFALIGDGLEAGYADRWGEMCAERRPLINDVCEAVET